MAPHAAVLLREMLRDLRASPSLDRLAGLDWDLLIRQARQAGLLARLAVALDAGGLLAAVPERPRAYLEGERSIAETLARDVRWDVAALQRDLAETDAPLVLLKGAAYVLADLPPGRGRIFGDIDILVPLDRIAAVEAALKRANWYADRLAPYDERYYRRWMHQIPPLAHAVRGATVDVHHTIVARTSRLLTDAKKLFAAAVPMPGHPDLAMLAPEDLILHSATHLLNEGDFDRGLRDLDDLNLLLRHFSAAADFWPRLIARAAELDLRRPLYYALRHAHRWLGTPVPDEVMRAPRLKPPGPVLRAVMDPLFERALRPLHRSARDALTPVALGILYVRGHLLLMPLHILLPHLLRKAIMRLRRAEERPAVLPQKRR